MSDFCQKHASYDQCGRAAERWLYGNRDSVYDRIHGRRGGDLYDSDMGDIKGGNTTFNNNGYKPTPDVDHITVYNDNARVSWNMQNGQVAPDVKGKREPHLNKQ